MAAKIAQPTPRDIREVVEGLTAPAELATSARLTAIFGLVDPAELIASRG
jgi:hypothetical protein